MKYATLEEATAAAIKAGSDLDNGAFPQAVRPLSQGTDDREGRRSVAASRLEGPVPPRGVRSAEHGAVREDPGERH